MWLPGQWVHADADFLPLGRAADAAAEAHQRPGGGVEVGRAERPRRTRLRVPLQERLDEVEPTGHRVLRIDALRQRLAVERAANGPAAADLDCDALAGRRAVGVRGAVELL